MYMLISVIAFAYYSSKSFLCIQKLPKFIWQPPTRMNFRTPMTIGHLHSTVPALSFLLQDGKTHTKFAFITNEGDAQHFDSYFPTA